MRGRPNSIASPAASINSGDAGRRGSRPHATGRWRVPWAAADGGSAGGEAESTAKELGPAESASRRPGLRGAADPLRGMGSDRAERKPVLIEWSR